MTRILTQYLDFKYNLNMMIVVFSLSVIKKIN